MASCDACGRTTDINNLESVNISFRRDSGTTAICRDCRTRANNLISVEREEAWRRARETFWINTPRASMLRRLLNYFSA